MFDYVGLAAGQAFAEEMKGESITIRKYNELIKHKVPLTEAEQNSFDTAVNCHILNDKMGDHKVRDAEALLTQTVNLNYKNLPFVPVLIQHLSGYDPNLFINELVTWKGRLM